MSLIEAATFVAFLVENKLTIYSQDGGVNSLAEQLNFTVRLTAF